MAWQGEEGEIQDAVLPDVEQPPETPAGASPSAMAGEAPKAAPAISNHLDSAEPLEKTLKACLF